MLLFGAVLLTLMWGGMIFAIRGELYLPTRELGGLRLWRVNSETDQGIGLSTSRSVPTVSLLADVCYRTTARFFLWRSSGMSPAQSYCECYEGNLDQWRYVGECNPE